MLDVADNERLIRVLSIALITILALLVLNLIKIRTLKKDNKKLHKQIEKQ